MSITKQTYSKNFFIERQKQCSNNYILDFDGDDMLGESDLRQVIERLIGEQNHLADSDMKQLIQVLINIIKPYNRFHMKEKF